MGTQARTRMNRKPDGRDRTAGYRCRTGAGGGPLALQWRPAARDDIEDSDSVQVESSASKARCYRNSAGIEIVSSVWVKRVPCMKLIDIQCRKGGWLCVRPPDGCGNSVAILHRSGAVDMCIPGRP